MKAKQVKISFIYLKNIEDIKYNQRAFTEEIKGINERLIKAEESIKNAHIRIDHIERRILKNDKYTINTNYT